MTRRTPRAEDWRGLEELREDLERSLARACRDRSLLDDVVQETLLRAASRRDGLENPERLRSWLLRIAWNVMRDQFRRDRRLRGAEEGDELLEELPERPPAESGPRVAAEIHLGPRIYDGVEVHEVLCRVLPELPPDDRRLFDAYYRRSRGCGSIAAELGVTPQTVKMRLFRLRRRIRRRLRQRSALDLTPVGAVGGGAA
jgi:RNA polymerase sigma factor (sigma-70 family)